MRIEIGKLLLPTCRREVIIAKIDCLSLKYRTLIYKN